MEANLILKPGNEQKLLFYKNDKNFNEKDISVTISLSAETLEKLLKKELTNQQAFMKGLVKIKGNMMDAMKLDNLISFINYE